MADSEAFTAHVDTYCRDHLPPHDQWPQLEFTLPELNYPDRFNCATVLLDETIAKYGADRRCLTSGDETWTYGDVLRHANQIAHVLTEDLGLVPGGRVLLRGFNSLWMAACWFGALKAGGVVVATMPLLRAHEIRALIDRTKSGIALCDRRLDEEMIPAAEGIISAYFGGDGPDDIITLAATKPADFNDVLTAADDVALLAPTSGTTGVPKATMQFHRDVLAVCDTFSKYVLKPTPDDVFTGTPPIGFTFGLGGLLLFPLRAGASAVLMERGTQDAIADAIENKGTTILFTAPTAYRAMVRAGRADILGKLRRAVSAGEHLPGPVWQEIHDNTGLSVIDGIGSTEMMHVFISASDDDIRPGATGRAVPGYRAMVIDDYGREVPRGQIGRLAVIGPTGCRYLDDARQQDYVHDGWNITGDTYIEDDDGYFWYQARNDDMIISSGYNIAAPSVEQALLQHTDVLECAVIGIPDEDRGQLVHAVVVLRDGISGDDAKRAELQNFVKNTIAPYQYPRSLEFRTELPKSTTGKLQRYKLRQDAGEQQTPSERTRALRSITTRRRLEWRDTDASGHQHHSVIIRWVEQAEAELFEALGCIELFDRIPRVKYEAEYHARLWFRDEVDIKLTVVAIGRTSMTYNFEITGPRGVAATGRVVIVHTSPAAGRAEPWPPGIRSALVAAGAAG